MKAISRFSRIVDNLAKKGQYFTDPEHCEAIGNLMIWPENEFPIMDPSIGNAVGLLSFLGEQKAVTYGVEIDKEIHDNLKQEEMVDYLLNEDFLEGVQISNGVFPVIFSNPPYGNVFKERLETIFLKSMTKYLKRNGILVYIIPYTIIDSDPNFCNVFANRFHVEAVYKFHANEFKKYKQVVIIGRKKDNIAESTKAEGNELFLMLREIETLEELPFSGIEPFIKIPGANDSSVTYFRTRNVDLEELKSFYKKGTLLDKINILPRNNVDRAVTPPIPPLKGHLNLLSSVGFQHGKVGSIEKKDLHL